MGNGALAPADVAAFWHAVGSGTLLNSTSLEQMFHFAPFTTGTEAPCLGGPSAEFANVVGGASQNRLSAAGLVYSVGLFPSTAGVK